jgi:hypothetical protein
VSGGSAEAASLVWLRELAISDQVALLRYPRRTISAEVAGNIAEVLTRSAVVMQLWGPADRWRLSERLASQLSGVREKLDKWWNSNSMTVTDRNYLIEHRADAELPPHTVRVEPPVICAYLEMKVRETAPL